MVILRPSELAGKILLLGSGRQLFGRDECADIRLEDQHLSAVHAAITNVDGRVTVEDLGSSNGTRVDGETIMGTRPLRDGDVITFGGVDALFEQTNDAGTRPTAPSTTALPIEANGLRRTDRAAPGRVIYDVDRQSGRHISNVGHDQYNSFVQQRESFLREVAASRTKARFIFWTGLVMTAVGALGYAFFLVKTHSRATSTMSPETRRSTAASTAHSPPASPSSSPPNSRPRCVVPPEWSEPPPTPTPYRTNCVSHTRTAEASPTG